MYNNSPKLIDCSSGSIKTKTTLNVYLNIPLSSTFVQEHHEEQHERMRKRKLKLNTEEKDKKFKMQ